MAPDSTVFPNRRIAAVPLSYWHDCYLDALVKAERSRDPALREIYLELADHYRSLDALVGEVEDAGTAAGNGHPNGKAPQ